MVYLMVEPHLKIWLNHVFGMVQPWSTMVTIIIIIIITVSHTVNHMVEPYPQNHGLTTYGTFW